jgi:hypothetical protein
VQFETLGCLGSYDCMRAAAFRDGVLSLDKAVSAYDGDTYDRLYAIEYEGTPYLLPATAVPDYEKSFPKNQVFRRLAAKKPSAPSQ